MVCAAIGRDDGRCFQPCVIGLENQVKTFLAGCPAAADRDNPARRVAKEDVVDLLARLEFQIRGLQGGTNQGGQGRTEDKLHLSAGTRERINRALLPSLGKGHPLLFRGAEFYGRSADVRSRRQR